MSTVLIVPTQAAATSASFTLTDGDLRTLNVSGAGNTIRNDALVRVEMLDAWGNWIPVGLLGLAEGLCKNLWAVGTFRVAKDATACTIGCDVS